MTAHRDIFRTAAVHFSHTNKKGRLLASFFGVQPGSRELLHCARKNQRTNINLLFHHAVFKEEGLIGFKALHIGFGEDVVEAECTYFL